MSAPRIRARDQAVQRLRVVTTVVAGAAGALALVFGLVAAKAFPGRSTHAAVRTPLRRPAPAAVPTRQTAPELVQVNSQAQPPSPAAPAAPQPAPTAAAPVAVSGGS